MSFFLRSSWSRVATAVRPVATLSNLAMTTRAKPNRRAAAYIEPVRQGSVLGFLGIATASAVVGYYLNSSHNTVLSDSLASSAQNEVQAKSAPTRVPKLDYRQVYKDIATLLKNETNYDDGSYGPVFVRLAWHQSGTWDKGTKTGGSDGATMRFKPESTYLQNAGLSVARDILEEKIHKKYPDLSHGDLWTLAGVCAIQEAGGPQIPWRPGRTDQPDGKQCTPEGRLPDAEKGPDHARDIFYRMGFNDREIVALLGGHTLGRCHPDRMLYDGIWQKNPTKFTNAYFTEMEENTWIKKKLPTGVWQWNDDDTPDIMMLPIEVAMYNDKGFRPYFELYAKDEAQFFKDFADAFRRLLELGVPFKGDEEVYVFDKLNA